MCRGTKGQERLNPRVGGQILAQRPHLPFVPYMRTCVSIGFIQYMCVCSVLLQIRVAALQNLVRIVSLYYQYMESYMGPALFAVSPVGTVSTGASTRQSNVLSPNQKSKPLMFNV